MQMQALKYLGKINKSESLFTVATCNAALQILRACGPSGC